MDASDLGYVNAHGTATNKGDTVETASIKNVFGDKLPYVNNAEIIFFIFQNPFNANLHFSYIIAYICR